MSTAVVTLMGSQADHHHSAPTGSAGDFRITKERSGDITLEAALQPGPQQLRTPTSRNLDLTPGLLKIQMWIVGNIRADINRGTSCVLTEKPHRLA